MADVIDMAQDMEARERTAAISEALYGRQDDPGPVYLAGAACCRECEEPIPPRRLAALPGVGLCITCAARQEAARA